MESQFDFGDDDAPSLIEFMRSPSSIQLISGFVLQSQLML
jgi:hypothetical protein